MVRAFLALPIPAHVRSQLLLQQFLMPVDRKVPPENFHITLVFLGDCPLPALEELHLELSRTTFPALRLQIRGLGLFGKKEPHNLHARVVADATLSRVQARLETLARRCGLVIPSRRFTPHVTLAYLRPGNFDPVKLESSVAQDALFATDTFDVTEVALMRSVLRSDGAVHDLLETYALDVSALA